MGNEEWPGWKTLESLEMLDNVLKPDSYLKTC